MNMISHPAVPKALEGMPIVDADTHICEPADLWTSRAPAHLKARVPQVKMIDGGKKWVMDGDMIMGPAFPMSAIRANGKKSNGYELINYDMGDAFPGAVGIKDRVAFMDSAGISAQIAYPNLLGFGNQKAMGAYRSLRLAITQIYNDAMADIQKESGDRIFPMALLPWWDIKE
jgi:predicted TIM-barrel fold metal-dependent hydrolase